MKRSKFLLNSLFIIFFTTQIIVSEQDSTEVIQIQTNEAVTPVGPFSQAMLVKNPKELLFIAGQLPVDPVTNILANDLAAAQFETAIGQAMIHLLGKGQKNRP